ncbi:MAG: dihydrodipicolinate reductase [Proteobacteria bacterium]|nr:dihydrodipicolinate reductase [Pseudomonadota bacterium]
MVYNVIQWSSGNVGKHVVQAVAERKNMKLAGLYVYSDDKAGQDAGAIAGIGNLGVIATNDVNDILKTDADVVIHSPLPSLVYGEDPNADVDAFCKLLASGKNVITTVGYMYPKVHGPALVRRLNAACKKGNSTFHSTGLNPGWVGDLLPLTMSSLSKSIDQVYVQEISNFQYYPSPEIMFDMMGFGKTNAEFRKHAARYTNWLTGLFRENIQMVADGLGVKLDKITDKTTRVLATRNLKTAAGTVKKGTVAGQHWEWAGMVGRKKIIVHETVWRMHESVAKDWPQGVHSVAIKGEPNMRIELSPMWIDGGLLSTATHAVNAVPYVCDAEPGIKTFLDLPWIMGKGLVNVPQKTAPKKKAPKK